MRILLTNDDGIFAPGINAFYNALTRLGDVEVVAPASEQSGVGLSVTYMHPLLVEEEVRDGAHWGWAVAGSPADSSLARNPGLGRSCNGLSSTRTWPNPCR